MIPMNSIGQIFLECDSRGGDSNDFTGLEDFCYKSLGKSRTLKADNLDSNPS